MPTTQRKLRVTRGLLAALLAGAMLMTGAGAVPMLQTPLEDLPEPTQLLPEDESHESHEDHAEGEVASFSSAFFHTQSRGNRGEDVKAIQYLLRARGYSVSADGVFGTGTESAVKSFQSSVGLTADGIVGPNTWGKLVITVKRGSSGEAVKAVQNLLNHKRGAGLAVDGVFGSGTESAVKTFQSHAGISSDGIVGSTTWKNLVWHYERPNTGLASVCAYGSSSARWGTAAAVGQLESAAALFYSRGYGPVAVGDLSLEHGGDIAGHASHEVGLDADLRPIRNDGLQCSYGTSVGYSSYSSSRTKQLCWDLRARASGHVKLIFFNDQDIINSGCSQYYSNHANHLHIRYCELVHPNSYYRC